MSSSRWVVHRLPERTRRFSFGYASEGTPVVPNLVCDERVMPPLIGRL